MHLSLLATGQQVMVWAPSSLAWSLYQVRAEGSGNQVAFSYTGIEYSVSSVDERPSVSFDAVFNITESWVQDGKADAALLTHEQVLFDLTELYARKMRKQTDAWIMDHQAEQLTITSMLPEVRRIYRQYMNELLEKIRQYNAETMNGKNAKAQQRWNAYVAGELTRLEMFGVRPQP